MVPNPRRERRHRRPPLYHESTFIPLPQHIHRRINPCVHTAVPTGTQNVYEPQVSQPLDTEQIQISNTIELDKTFDSQHPSTTTQNNNSQIISTPHGNQSPSNQQHEQLSIITPDTYQSSLSDIMEQQPNSPSHTGFAEARLQHQQTLGNSANSSELPTSDGPHQQEQQLSSTIETLREGLRLMVSWRRLFAYLSLFGKARFTSETYEIMACAISTSNVNSCTIPTYKTVKGKQHDYFTSICLPKNEIMHMQSSSHSPSIRNAAKLITTSTNEQRDVRECMKLVLPSSWAQFDVSLYHTYMELYGEARSSCQEFSIEQSSIVRTRKNSVGSANSFWVLDDGSIVHAEKGSIIDIPCKYPAGFSSPPQPWTIRNCQQSTLTEETYFVKGEVGPQWCVGSSNSISPRTSTTNQEDFTDEEKQVFSLLRHSDASINDAFRNQVTSNTAVEPCSSINIPVSSSHVPRRSDRRLRGIDRRTRGQLHIHSASETSTPTCTINHRSTIIYPSDTCTFIRPPTGQPQHNKVCIFVSSIVSNTTGSSAEKIIWLEICSSTSTSLNGQEKRSINGHINLRPLLILTIIDNPILLSHDDTVPESSNYVPPAGKLDDGTPYLIYRASFYADEFKERRSKSNVRNVCGCYMRPMAISNRTINSATAVHVMTLTPYGQDSNFALIKIIEDIVHGTVNGIDAIDPFGNRVKVFLDIPIFFGDYVKMAAVTDSMGHMATCFCGYCSLLRDYAGSGPTYVFTTKAHSRRLGFMRCEDRLSILRPLQLHTAVKKTLGFSCESNFEAMKLPLVNLSHALRQRVKDIRKTASGLPVVQPYFDSYQSTAVAPDHLLSGLVHDILKCCFEAISSMENRTLIEAKILSAAAANGLQTEGTFLAHKDGKFTGIKSMSMSTLFVIIMVSIPYFNRLSMETSLRIHPFSLPGQLHSYISLLYFWPTKAHDCQTDIDMVHGNNRKTYYSRLLARARSYTNSTARFINNCGENFTFKPDKPNGHRLLELTVHTLPLFGHGLFISELIFELVHFFFKKWLEDNRSPDSHITAVDIALCRSWAMNVYMALLIWNGETGREKYLAERSSTRLFFGENVLYSNSSLPSISDLMETFRNRLPEIFRHPIPMMLKGGTNTGFSDVKYIWRSERSSYIVEDNTLKTKGLQFLANYLQISTTSLVNSCTFHRRASLYSLEKYDCSSRTYPYRTISYGTAVTLIIPHSQCDYLVFDGANNPQGKRIYVGVLYIFKHNNVLYIMGIMLLESNGSVSYSQGDLRIIRLNSSITRVGLIHECTNECKLSPSGRLEHSGNIFSGETYTVLPRSKGYPPHVG